MCECSPSSVSINKGDKAVPFYILGAKRMTVWLNATLHAAMQRNKLMEPRKRHVNKCACKCIKFSISLCKKAEQVFLCLVQLIIKVLNVLLQQHQAPLINKTETGSDVKKVARFYCVLCSMLDIWNLMQLQRHATQTIPAALLRRQVLLPPAGRQ